MPGAGHHRLDGPPFRRRLGEALQGLLSPRQGGIDGRRGHRLALQAPAHTGHVVLEAVHEALGLAAGRPHGLVALAPGPPTLLVRRPQRLGRLGLGGARAIHGLGDLALLAADRGERRLEGALVLGQAAARVGDDRVGQPEPLGDREGLRPARQPDRQPVGRADRVSRSNSTEALRASGVSWA